MGNATLSALAPSAGSDLALLNASLEIAVMQSEDFAPAVFQRFFSECPSASKLFTIPDPSMPPLGCGQMVFEIISLILDQAAGEAYVASYMHQIATEHSGFDVRDPEHYKAFLTALVDTLAQLAGNEWNAEFQTAWSRQCACLLDRIPTQH